MAPCGCRAPRPRRRPQPLSAGPPPRRRPTPQAPPARPPPPAGRRPSARFVCTCSPLSLNEITLLKTPLSALVLDHYHLVTGGTCSRACYHAAGPLPTPAAPGALINGGPTHRCREPAGSRRGELAQVRAQQLRLSLTRRGNLLGGLRGTQLSEQDVHRLLARTEGWAAGRQLAALRLEDRADPSAFIERFQGADGTSSAISARTFDPASPAGTRLPLPTSVLNRMCAPLCNALTGRPDGAELISEVHRANLFLIPLDDERRWFRYHHLFAGLLRHELPRSAGEAFRAASAGGAVVCGQWRCGRGHWPCDRLGS